MTTGNKSEKHLEPSFVRSLGIGGIAGIIAASCVYPLDISKAYMQVNRGSNLTIRQALAKVYASGGFRALYRGLPANIIGITPEKAIKLSIFDYVRRRLGCANPSAPFSWSKEAFAGGFAGFCQFVATNPMEIVKLRLQLAGPGSSLAGVVRDLGVRGLFRGSTATLSRDIPFSAGYFSSFAYLKRSWGTDPLNVFAASLTAGIGFAWICTPMDVVKTRLQGSQELAAMYNGSVIKCFTMVAKDEGAKALFKGAGARVTLLGPLFGIALTSYSIIESLWAEYLI
ncbi:mitochondrial solute carrier family 25 (mitochondrial aspartate/glutamate transporter) member 12/13 [Andalucia godoyi]|uniref:Mitochondrial solute carrier family 25 (Mitochondrial aspartate/glutamate transporter) member 12/13 n=1 Tax=Andalucia godoyi TaxID=505711 RepID=A0A8K0F2G1_ANDGO|nr:mitochondrial solute carrier family 25 (mitochondrial aspartate/glutamate transporter) member 12/13 [Andalucia godoyi]|eukprot:ANDGO_02535.mRNA.1 mitochondrial solute carrier family 25 (mitochondrial aspartate/glutamate transporter) member 12/13